MRRLARAVAGNDQHVMRNDFASPFILPRSTFNKVSQPHERFIEHTLKLLLRRFHCRLCVVALVHVLDVFIMFSSPALLSGLHDLLALTSKTLNAGLNDVPGLEVRESARQCHTLWGAGINDISCF